MTEINCAVYMMHEVNLPTLERLIASNLGENRHPLTIFGLTNLMRGLDIRLFDKYFCLSFDDRLRSQWDALPLLDRYKIPATFFAMSQGWPGDGVHSYMSDDQIFHLPPYHELGDHTINHPTNPSLPQLRVINPGEYAAEIQLSKQRLESLTGRRIFSFASPQSFYDPTLINDLVSLGYTGAAATYEGDNYNPIQRDPMQIMRKRMS